MAIEDPADGAVVLTSDDGLSRDDENRRRGFGALILAILIGLIALWWILTQTTVVPDLSGYDRAAATALLRARSLSEGTVSAVRTSQQPPGRVANQSPFAGARVLRGTEIDFALAVAGSAENGDGSDSDAELQGYALDPDEIDGGSDIGDQPKPRTYPEYSGPYVPDVQALSESDAIGALRAAGYRATVEYGPVTSGPGKGKVYFQNPEPLAYAARGTIVEIWVSTGGPGVGNLLTNPRPKVNE